jgi:hypothetical protein
MAKSKKSNAKAHKLKANTKWFVSNNKAQKNVDVINIIPFLKVWYSKRYFLETGLFTPAFGIAVSFLKWNYYFTIQKAY